MEELIENSLDALVESGRTNIHKYFINLLFDHKPSSERHFLQLMNDYEFLENFSSRTL